MSPEVRELLDNLEKAAEKMNSVHQEFASNHQSNSEKLSSLIQTLKQMNPNSKIDQTLANNVKTNFEPVESSVEKMRNNHKDAYNLVSKCSKDKDKLFPDDLHKIHFAKTEPEWNRTNLDFILLDYLLINGNIHIANTLCDELNLNRIDSTPYLPIQEIARDLANRQKNSLLAWMQKNSENVVLKNSRLSVLLSKLELSQILSQNRISDFLHQSREKYSTSNYPIELVDHIKKLMSFMIISNSKFDDGIITEIWADIRKQFLRTATLILQKTPNSSLELVLQVGLRVMDPFLNFIRRTTDVQFSGGSVIQVDLFLHQNFLHHSIYVCCVLKEVCTDSNKPMRLKCGHFISESAFKSLFESGHGIRCQYCPMLSKMKHVMTLKM